MVGERGAFKELLTIYSSKVVNTCYRFLLNKEEAEDVAQEVFIEVFQSIHSFKGNAKLSTWIYRIAVTKSLDEIKKRNRKKRISSLGKMLHLDEFTNLLIGADKADCNIHNKEQMVQLSKALSKLPDNQRIAFTLGKIEGYSNIEIAAIMNISTIAVESLVYRAKKKVSTDLLNILSKL